MAKANSIVTDRALIEKGYKAYIPRHLISISGVLTGIPAEITNDEIFEGIESTKPVLSVYRLSRYVEGVKVPTNRVSVTFRTSSLPERIKLFCTSCKIYPFIRKIQFCTKCHRYNHDAQNCRGKERCKNCARIHESDGINNCISEVKCYYCKTSQHKTEDPSCPERQRQASIKKIMAKKNLTYIEAKELTSATSLSNSYDILANITDFPTLTESYARTTAERNMNRNNREPTEGRQSTSESDKRNRSGTNFGNDQFKRKRLDTNHTNRAQTTRSNQNSNNGVALQNQFKTTEKEKIENAIAEAVKKASENANNSARAEIMSFYSALFQIPEITEAAHEKM